MLRVFFFSKAIFLCLLVVLPLFCIAQPEKPLMNVDQLVGEALQNNPEIQAANQKWEVFKEKVPQAFALEDPMCGFGTIRLPTNFSLRDGDMTMKEISVSPKFPFYGKRLLMREMAVIICYISIIKSHP